MTGDEYRAALRALGWKQSDLARRVQMSKNACSNWAQEGPPAWVGEYLGALMAIDDIHRRFVRPLAKVVPKAPATPEEENAGPLPTGTRAAAVAQSLLSFDLAAVSQQEAPDGDA